MSDLIDRQAAIDELHMHLMYRMSTESNKQRLDEWINNLPSAQPERKTGKWEIYVISPFDGEGCRCSECKYEGAPYWDFCPNCGADMRGEQDG